MDVYVLDQNFTRVAVVDSYESILWIDRYNKPGEFELYLLAEPKILTYLKEGNYVVQKDSEHVCKIEGVEINTSVETGNHYIIKGRSIESILDRRIVWNQTTFNNVYLQTAIQRLLNENVINPSIAARKIPNFIFEASTDTAITTQKITAQYTGDNILDLLQEICDNRKIGFMVTLNDNHQFVFKLYSGKDRSYDQTNNNYVVFSPEFDNIVNSNYQESDVSYKNVTLVAGEGEGSARKTYVVGNTTGLERRELYTDARDIQSTDENQNPIPAATYNEMLRQRGLEKLAECKRDKNFDGQVETFKMFIYKRDFYMGDIIQIKNEYGLEGPARVVEYVMSENVQNGLEYYPTFEAIQEE